MIASLRNIPVLMWNAAADELVPETSYLPTAQELDRLGYRYELDIYSGEHLRWRSTTSSCPRPSSSARRRSTATRRTSPTPSTRASTTPT